MNRFFTKIIGAALNGFTKKNLNPKTSKTTGAAYAGAGVIALLAENPPGTEYDVLIQAAIAVVSLICFYKDSGETK